MHLNESGLSDDLALTDQCFYNTSYTLDDRSANLGSNKLKVQCHGLKMIHYSECTKCITYH